MSKITSRNQINKVRAASVVIALLLGWLCTPALLAAQTLDTCSMQCCVERKQCCCTPRHASVREPVDGKEKLERNAIESRCPEGCLAPKVINSFSLSYLSCASASSSSFDGSTDLAFHRVDLPLEHQVLRQSSPRAPPVSFQDQIA
ncbi:MAG TPA: hypothetical protein VJX74_01135 [Blastocatellia bacterium]|nr:hypothetical protein [Blastocatellia bacterium]